MTILNKNTIICLIGPTASGKSKHAFLLAKQLNCEIISVDSVSVYRSLNIGSAKPRKAEQEQIPYHLINIRDPKNPYSAANFCEDATHTIQEILKRGKTPLLVGGTMLYFHALLFGLSNLPSANKKIRARLTEEAKKYNLYERLMKIDPESAKHIHKNDPQRLQRALEIFELTGKTLTQLKAEGSKKAWPYPYISLVIAPKTRKILHERIKKRFEQMLENGLIEEVQKLYNRGDLNDQLPAIRAIGYRQIWQYLEGKCSYAEMKEKAIIATRQLAKHQLTWLKHWKNPLHWFDSDDPNTIQKMIAYIRTLP